MRIYERLTPLNARERRSAEKHHALLTTYIKRHNLDSREFYDVCVFGYLKAVKRWFSRSDLHVYKFATIANKAMSSYLYNERQKRNRRIKTISLDTEIVGQESVMYADTVTYDDLDYINYV